MKCTWSLILKELVGNFKLVIKNLISLMSRMYMNVSVLFIDVLWSLLSLKIPV